MSESGSNIDKLFGDRLRNDDQGFREEHWENMEKLLDAQSARPAPFFTPRKKLLSVLVAALLGAVAVLYMFDRNPNDSGIVQTMPKQDAAASKQEDNIKLNEMPAPVAVAPGRDETPQLTAPEVINENINKSNTPIAAEIKRSSTANKSKKNITDVTSEKSVAAFPLNTPPSEQIPVPEMGSGIKFKPAEKPEEKISKTFYEFLSIQPRWNRINPAIIRLQLDSLNNDLNPQLGRKHQFKVLIGANSFKGMSDDNSEGKWTMTPVLGFSYDYRLSRLISIGAEVDYLRRSGNSLNRSTTTITYFHHKEYNIHSLKTKTMDFVFVPVTASYRIGSRHYLKGGAAASFLLSTISDRKETFRNYYSEKESVSTDLKGYYTGLRKVNVGFTIGYEFRTDQRSYLGVRYSRSLNDFTDNTYFKSNSRDMMSDLQLYIRLNAF